MARNNGAIKTKSLTYMRYIQEWGNKYVTTLVAGKRSVLFFRNWIKRSTRKVGDLVFTMVFSMKIISIKSLCANKYVCRGYDNEGCIASLLTIVDPTTAQRNKYSELEKV